MVTGLSPNFDGHGPVFHQRVLGAERVIFVRPNTTGLRLRQLGAVFASHAACVAMMSLGVTACATTDIETRLAHLRAEHQTEVHRLDEIREQIRLAKVEEATEKLRAQAAQCVAGKRKAEARVAVLQAACTIEHAHYEQCQASGAQHEASMTGLGCIAGAALTGVGLIGCGLGMMTGAATETRCVQPTCELAPERILATVVAESGWTAMPRCGGRLGATTRDQLTARAVPITRVAPGTPAASIDLRKDDLLVTVGPCQAAEFVEATCSVPRGETVRVEYLRQGARLARDVMLAAKKGAARSLLGIDHGEIPPVAVGMGVEVTGFEPESPAERSGLRTGDRIVAVSGVPTRVVSELTAALESVIPGDAVEVGVVRAGAPVTVTVTLGDWPSR